MLDVITFGSATWDIFIRDGKILSGKDKRFLTGKGLYFPLGSKIDIDELRFSTGGGGTNSAATFLMQGFKTAYCGGVGNDPAGEEVIAELKRRGADVSLISKTAKKPTNHSIILSIPGKDRTILTYKGASEYISLKNIFTRKTLSKWFYIAPFSGKLTASFGQLVNFAFKKGIKIAVNPGKSQLNLPAERLEGILEKTDILILNQEEASTMTKTPYSEERDIIKKIRDFYPGIFVMTKGSKGSIVSNKERIYSVGTINSKVIDRTGAGDSFGAGFVSAIIRGDEISDAIQFASANATACLEKWGAKNGLIKKGASYKKLKIDIYEIR